MQVRAIELGCVVGTRGDLCRIIFVALGASLAASSPLHAQACGLTRESLDASGAQIPLASLAPGLSGNGRFVAFYTKAQLVAADTNQKFDIYVRDVLSGALDLVSIGYGGTAASDDSSGAASLSADGRFVAFSSEAQNLLPYGTLPGYHVFVRDRLLGQTQLASVGNGGASLNAYGDVHISADGRFVAFVSNTACPPASDTNGDFDTFVRDMQLGKTKPVSQGLGGQPGNGASGLYGNDLSADGRYVVFSSYASNLVANDGNSESDVFRRDLVTGTLELVSLSSSGTQGTGGSWSPRCSDDGRFVAFTSSAPDLVPADNNGVSDVFVRDMLTGATQRISTDPSGFDADDESYGASISPDGRFVVYLSEASNLVPGDTNGEYDVFLYDRVTQRTERVSVTSAGAQVNSAPNWAPDVSRDGGVVAFGHSAALVPNDTNAAADIYERRCALPATYCTAKVNSQGCLPSISSSGIPLSSWPSGFQIGARQVLNQKLGLLFYSTSGPNSNPFQGGTLCVRQPLRRTAPQSSGGSSAGSDCTGTFAFDFNAWIASGLDSALVAGASVWAQFWSRDPGFAAPNNSSLSDATSFVIWP